MLRRNGIQLIRRHLSTKNAFTCKIGCYLGLLTLASVDGNRRLTSLEADKPQRNKNANNINSGKLQDRGKQKEETVFDVAKNWMKDTRGDGAKFLNEHILSQVDMRKDKAQKQNKTSTLDDENKTSERSIPNPISGFVDDILKDVKEILGSDESEDELIEMNSNENDGLFGFAKKKIISLTLGTDGSSPEEGFRHLVERAREAATSHRDGDINETSSFPELVSLFYKKAGEVDKALNKSFDHVDFTQFDPTSLWYYLEHEDGLKNPSWKRMKHRFHRSVDLQKVEQLNDALYLADLSYADKVEEVKCGLEKAQEPWELIYCTTTSYPERPSHFLAVKKGQSRWSNALEVLIVVRGTKSVEDLLTDALLEAEDYRGGKAHAGIVRSGKYLVEKHEDLLQNLLQMSGKGRINLTLVGHSLGAGVASIAGMEYNDRKNINVSVIGFGCPALLSFELSESTIEYITTVVADSDLIPRMNSATIGNVILDVMEFDWTSMGRRDVKQALNELKSNASNIISHSDVERTMEYVDSMIEKKAKPGIKKNTEHRMEPVLFPPGSCIHFYRNGSGLSGTYAPCNFFNEIDISRTMVADHLISSGYNHIFLELMRQYHNDAHFSFEKNKDSK